jgi:hypothetical protein|tara:strand:- start:312 stop:434 length:123 start_codon:yes stop_codon:yes gene_type:complete
MGGQYNREGYVSRDSLMQIIETEFELTIDMKEFLRGIGGD